MTMSSSSQWDPLGPVHTHRPCWEDPKLRLQNFPESRAPVKGAFNQAAGMILLVHGGRAHSERSSSGKFGRILEMWASVSLLLFDVALGDLIGPFFRLQEEPV